MDSADAVVIGGGFFGCNVAVALREHGLSATLLEAESSLMRRASWGNQARVHHGYHYPRSILTGVRSRANFQRFVDDHADCIDRSFQMLYAVAEQRSNVTAQQFEAFCERIGAPLAIARPAYRELFQGMEAVYEVDEFAFDADRLAKRMGQRMRLCGVDVRLQTRAERIDGDVVVHTSAGPIATRHVFNCTYAGLNGVLVRSALQPVPLNCELTEMALVEVPPALRAIGITVMCGPFFSLMPFPSLGLHTLSHVRYTPHHKWSDPDAPAPSIDAGRTQYPHMVRDVARFVPLARQLVHERSIWEVKAKLPSSSFNDSRPILFYRHPDQPRLVSILGGKIDNVYDLRVELDSYFAATAA